MKLRIEEVLKQKGKDLNYVAEKLGVTYNAIYLRIKGNMRVDKLQEIAGALDTEPAELIQTGEGYSHFYDDKTGEWLGIRKK
ncbi:helix-turn-helix domain-containing protein [Chryseobacterium viscerum]|uniref:Helix-turn-helix transcriptional regulator n=1 Tax=Chryseobacterium viscerum TaxID=1037377 RepID=A0A5N4BJ47_9FLAO|nr:helix-turn-helix transcriptional regulator [Chryseobacterium viscerum]KAB1228467.1 helix-turn-helix transcriptional regulator [Chryseobacterium viscerum]